MNNPWQESEHRLSQLLADRASFGLSHSEAMQVQRLTELLPDFDMDCMERAAATVQLADVPLEPMPSSVRAVIRDAGERYVAGLSPEGGGQAPPEPTDSPGRFRERGSNNKRQSSG